jgi:hypothetical protein
VAENLWLDHAKSRARIFDREASTISINIFSLQLSTVRLDLRRSLPRMPPPLPKGSLSSATRCRQSTTSIPFRSFSTTNHLSAIGPQNPKFIEIPIPPQEQARPKIDIKGTLPPPRNLFPKRAGDKTSTAYFAAVTPEPKEQPEPANEYVAWKRRMAESRRKNLRESLVELKKRQRDEGRVVAGISKARSAYREKRLHAPQREDERLTNPTILEINRTLQSGPVPDPNREARLAEKAARAQAKEAAKEDMRRNALHTLYMHARSFITTEEQFNREIEKIFTETPFLQNSREDNIWVAKGSPLTIQDMLSEVNKSQKSAIKYHAGPAAVTGKRLKKIAEELTGGKMD